MNQGIHVLTQGNGCASVGCDGLGGGSFRIREHRPDPLLLAHVVACLYPVGVQGFLCIEIIILRKAPQHLQQLHYQSSFASYISESTYRMKADLCVFEASKCCLLYTSDAADDPSKV